MKQCKFGWNSCLHSILMVALFCCFGQQGLAAPEFLTITDIHYGLHNDSEMGHDVGPQFLNIAMQEMTKLSKNVNFIVCLGDFPTHALADPVKKESFEATVFHALYAADSYKKPLFYVTGNNDSLQGNYAPFTSKGKSPLSAAVDWSGACLYCDGLMIDSSHMQQDGYYSAYAMPHNKDIVLIALNSSIFINRTFWLPKYPHQDTAAKAELAWLDKQLKENKRAKQIIIAMHIPPGLSFINSAFLYPEYSNQLISILEKNQHAGQQVSLLTAHTHMDELRKITLSHGTSIYAYSTPAVSRIHYNNAGMKVFSLNKDMTIKNYTTYYSTDLKTWGDAHYQAMGSKEAIFPQCTESSLAQCLDSMSDKEVCDDLEQGLFYGAKSNRVPANVCSTTYSVPR